MTSSRQVVDFNEGPCYGLLTQGERIFGTSLVLVNLSLPLRHNAVLSRSLVGGGSDIVSIRVGPVSKPSRRFSVSPEPTTFCLRSPSAVSSNTPAVSELKTMMVSLLRRKISCRSRRDERATALTSVVFEIMIFVGRLTKEETSIVMNSSCRHCPVSTRGLSRRSLSPLTDDTSLHSAATTITASPSSTGKIDC